MSSPNLEYLVRDKVLLANSQQKTYDNGFSIIFPWSEALGRFAKLTRWLEPRALVEKNQTSPLPYDFHHCAVDCGYM